MCVTNFLFWQLKKHFPNKVFKRKPFLRKNSNKSNKFLQKFPFLVFFRLRVFWATSVAFGFAPLRKKFKKNLKITKKGNMLKEPEKRYIESNSTQKGNNFQKRKTKKIRIWLKSPKRIWLEFSLFWKLPY